MFHFYLPFDSEDLKHGAKQFAGNTSTGKGGIHISGRSVNLSRIEEGDILYIFAHGRYGSPNQIVGEVRDWRGRTSNAYKTAGDVASELKRAGLRKTFSDIRCLVCWGGYVGESTILGKGAESHTLKRTATQVPFAGQLCSELKSKGYSRIRVVGYTGSIIFTAKGAGEVKEVKMDHWVTSRNYSGKVNEGWERIIDGMLGDPLTLGEIVSTRTRSGVAGTASPKTMTMNNENRTVWF